jgi:hypothetical protein
VPTAEDLDDPMEFAERLGGGTELGDDPIAELERTEREEKERGEGGSPQEG